MSTTPHTGHPQRGKARTAPQPRAKPLPMSPPTHPGPWRSEAGLIRTTSLQPRSFTRPLANSLRALRQPAIRPIPTRAARHDHTLDGRNAVEPVARHERVRRTPVNSSWLHGHRRSRRRLSALPDQLPTSPIRANVRTERGRFRGFVRCAVGLPARSVPGPNSVIAPVAPTGLALEMRRRLEPRCGSPRLPPVEPVDERSPFIGFFGGGSIWFVGSSRECGVELPPSPGPGRSTRSCRGQ
jgi:hypothetical protein